MQRNVDMNQISDGKFYGLNDMVKAGCDGCEGCSACCQGMGRSVILDPLDIFRMTKNLGVTFESLLAEAVELNVVDGIVLPNLKMSGAEEKCFYLDSAGRCSIHGFRPGICRLFPLGRFYEDRSFKYFLQVHECPKKNKSKVKVKNWIDTEDIRDYEQFICHWHYMLDDLQKKIRETSDDEFIKSISMYVLSEFYLKPYDSKEEIYIQLDRRIEETRHKLLY